MRDDSVERTLEIDVSGNSPVRQTTTRTGALTVLIGAEIGAVFALGQTSVIGRNPDAEVTLDDDGASRMHARVTERDGRYYLEDLGSTNGTYLGPQRVQAAMLLEEGSRILIGNTLLRFSMQDTVEQEALRRIYEMSVRDGLTGVFNRRYFEDRLASEFAFSVRHKSSLSVLLCDVDHFKSVNDRYGHPAGDMVLSQIASELRRGVRTEDVLARYGGEEFAVLGRGIDAAGARQFAERVRLMVADAPMVWEGERIAVTVSIGLSHMQGDTLAPNADRLVAAADAALYAAKRGGRNRVEMAGDPSRVQLLPQEPVARRRSRNWEQATRPARASQKPTPRNLTHKPSDDGDR